MCRACLGKDEKIWLEWRTSGVERGLEMINKDHKCNAKEFGPYF
jgi:hypothetical protein